MAAELWAFNCLIPAGTLKSAPITVAMAMPAREVVEIDVKVPPGGQGLVGWAIGSAATNVIPTGAGNWIVTDDEDIVWPLDNYIDSGAWEFYGYNTGKFAHTIYVRFQVNLPPVRGSLGAVNPVIGNITAPPAGSAPVAPVAVPITAPAQAVTPPALSTAPTLPGI